LRPPKGSVIDSGLLRKYKESQIRKLATKLSGMKKATVKKNMKKLS